MRFGEDFDFYHNDKYVRVLFRHFPKLDDEAVSPMDGAIIQDNKTTDIIIFINTDRPLHEQQITVGHELAHLLENHLEEENRYTDIVKLEKAADADSQYFYKWFKEEFSIEIQ